MNIRIPLFELKSVGYQKRNQCEICLKLTLMLPQLQSCFFRYPTFHYRPNRPSISRGASRFHSYRCEEKLFKNRFSLLIFASKCMFRGKKRNLCVKVCLRLCVEFF